MEVPVIPGFYYDPEKKKYFRIAANHLAPQGSKYSRAEVAKREKAEANKKEQKSFDERVSTQRIKRSKLSSHPILGKMGIQREIGYGNLSSTHYRGEACIELFERTRIYDNDYSNSSLLIRRVGRDPRTARLITTWNIPGPTALRVVSPTAPTFPWGYSSATPSCDFLRRRDEFVESFAISHPGHLMYVDFGPTFYSASVDRYRRALSHAITGVRAVLSVGMLESSSDTYNGDTFVGPSVRFSRFGWSICNVAASPDITSSTFTVGCGTDLVILSNNQAQWNLKTLKKFSSHISAVDWLSRNVIISGAMSSKVSLYDVRSEGSAARFQHSHGVQALKVLNGWNVIVAGHDSSLNMYDLRYAPNATDERPQPSSRSHRGTKPSCATNLRTVQLFSLVTGRKFKSGFLPLHDSVGEGENGQVEKLTTYCYKSNISSVHFDNLPDRFELLADYDDKERDFSKGGGAGRPSLLVASGSFVDEWHL
ncbi:hypothetical protein LOZ66_000465 [Ophidiomyces ophidiicola]|nr:hypothetical protein LOZ66_000465 [Ophidiomyces ophidiicola]